MIRRVLPLAQQSLLGSGLHRLLAAAEAARLAVVYSQYASLYVLTNAVGNHSDHC